MKKRKPFKKKFNLVGSAIFYGVCVLLLATFLSYNLFVKLIPTWGFYLIPLNVIGVRTYDIDMIELRQTINHEIGHFIYETCLPKKWVDEYKKVYGATDCKWAKDLSEDFAVTYAHYQTKMLDELFKAGFCVDKANYFINLQSENLQCPKGGKK